MRWKLDPGPFSLVLLLLYEFWGLTLPRSLLLSRVFKRRHKRKGIVKTEGDISIDSYDTDCISDYFNDSSSLESCMSSRSKIAPHTWNTTWSLASVFALSLGNILKHSLLGWWICSRLMWVFFFLHLLSVIPIIFLGVTAIVSLLKPSDCEQTSTSSPVCPQVLSCTCEESSWQLVTFSCF